MTEPNAQPQTTQDPNAPLVNPQAVYIKDCSFEAPSGPFLSQADGAPTVNLNLGTRATALSQDLHEVVLQVNLEAKLGDKVAWLLELQQAGAFTIRNLPANDLANVLSATPWSARPAMVEGTDRPLPLLYVINGGEDRAKMLRK